MNQDITGAAIKRLREAQGMTQAELAQKLNVSDKAVSKWETAKGCPDIAMLEPLAKVLNTSVAELLSGNLVTNKNISSNMLRSLFYVCPVCGNIIHSMGDASINCHGMVLSPCAAKPADEEHFISIEKDADEIYVSSGHNMSKQHYISFIAAVSPDRLQLVKLYPEGRCDARFKSSLVKRIFFYCSSDGLFSTDIK